MLNNRTKSDQVIKDYHYYNQKGNMWNNLARASNKTMDFYHRQKELQSKTLVEEHEDAKNIGKSQANLHLQHQIDQRRIASATSKCVRKAERFILQERSSQPTDYKYEPVLDKHIESLQDQQKQIMILKRSAIKRTLGAGGTSANNWNDFSLMSEKQAKINFPSKVLQYDEEAARNIYKKIQKDDSDNLFRI